MVRGARCVVRSGDIAVFLTLWGKLYVIANFFLTGEYFLQKRFAVCEIMFIFASDLGEKSRVADALAFISHFAEVA